MPALAEKRARIGDVFVDSFFQYAVNIGAGSFGTFTTGLETLVATIPIQADAHFLCVHTMYTDAQIATGLAAAPNVGVMLNGGLLVRLTDGRTGRDMTNLVGGVPIPTLFGTAQRPYMWPLTHIFQANSVISIQVTGQGVGPPTVIGQTFRLVFGGIKLPRHSVAQLVD